MPWKVIRKPKELDKISNLCERAAISVTCRDEWDS